MKYIKSITCGMLLVAGIVGVILWRFAPNEPSACSASFDDLQCDRHATNALFRASANASKTLCSPSYYPTESESNELVCAYMAIAQAYTNGSLSALRERMSAVPSVITNVAYSVCVEVQRPLRALFDDSFSFVRKVTVDRKVISLESNARDFSDANEFDDFVQRNIEMVKFLGETELQRGATSGYLVYLDKQVLKNLGKYREKFRSEGKGELAARADEHYRQWCEQIESMNGFARSYARFQVELQMSGGKTRERAVAIVRRQIGGIDRYGYTPKWLDEEFPLSEERTEDK